LTGTFCLIPSSANKGQLTVQQEHHKFGMWLPPLGGGSSIFLKVQPVKLPALRPTSDKDRDRERVNA
jgi:hypothetical protein